MKSLSESDAEQVKTILRVNTIKEIKEYASCIWDFTKYKYEQYVAVYTSEEKFWYGKILEIYAQQRMDIIFNVLIKISWFEEVTSTQVGPTRYFASGTIDFQNPQVLTGHILVVKCDDDSGDVYIQQHFVKYYNRYIKNKK